MPTHDVIVIGTSAGGVEALGALVAQLPADLPAAVLVVLHVSPSSPSILPALLNRRGPLVAIHPADGVPIRHGQIYVAPPDYHLLATHSAIRVMRGPKENRHRPAIDPLFRSAAAAFGPRVVGVILSGTGDDGTAGLLAIKRRGGLTVVQDPAEAAYKGMPESALAGVPVDHCLPLAGIAKLLIELTQHPAGARSASPDDMNRELNTMTVDTQIMELDERPGKHSVYSCPECGGVLWEIAEEGLLRFRCRVGHAFSLGSMLEEQSDALERALWMSLKILEERASLLHRMIAHAHERTRPLVAARMSEQLHEAEESAKFLRALLVKDVPPFPEPGKTATSPNPPEEPKEKLKAAPGPRSELAESAESD